MKYYKRLKLHKASNVTFNPETLVAYSYSWWQFVAVKEDKVVFNNYTYSNSTSRHQRKVRSLLYKLNIKIDLFANTRQSLESLDYDQIVLLSEEQACDDFLKEKERNIRAYERAKEKLPKTKLEREYNKLVNVANVTSKVSSIITETVIPF